MKEYTYTLIILLSLRMAMLNAMVSHKMIPVTLQEPELWASDGVTQLKGGPIPVYFHERYVDTFPQLKNYLHENENTLRGFDTRMFQVMNGCLKCAYFYKKALKDNNEIFIKAKMSAWLEKCSEKDLVDILDISEMAGLPSFISQWSKNELAKRKVKITDVYPDYFDFKDEVEQEYWTPEEKDEYKDLQSAASLASVTDSDSKNMQEPASSLRSRLSGFIGWVKSFFSVKSSEQIKACTDLSIRPNLSSSELREITKNFRERQTAFYHVIERAKEERIKKHEKMQREKENVASQSWWGKLKALAAYLFWE